MPRYPIDRATNFIVEEESWTVVEYDHTSVPGVIYLSLTEGKINSIYDDIKNNIADTDKLARYSLVMPPLTQIFHLGDHIEPKFSITKNGDVCDEPVELLTSDKKIVRNIDGELIAVGKGLVTIIAQLKNYPNIKQEMQITVGENEEIQEFSAYIEGPDTIRLDRKGRYELIGTTDITGEVTFTVSNTIYATKIPNENEDVIRGNVCMIHANANNKLGEIILTAEYNNNQYQKTIKIIPLW